MFPYLLVLALTTRMAVPYDIQNIVEYPTNCPHGHSVYKVEVMITITECVKECYRRTRCAGIRYHRPLQLCELFSNETFDMDTSVDKGACVLVAKTSDFSHTKVSRSYIWTSYYHMPYKVKFK